MDKTVVIIGSGQAGVTAAFKLRALGHKGAITLVGAEVDYPYHRPPLSKSCISGTGEVQPQLLKQEDGYEREHITFLPGRRATAIDRSQQLVIVNDGQTLSYEALILATGAVARNLEPIQTAGNVYTLRTIADARRLQGEVSPGRKLLVIGGGYIGLEIAAVARRVGMHVTLIEQGERILGRVASAETAAYFRALHQDQGVVLREGVGIEHFELKDKRVTSVRLTDGVRCDADAVVVGIGVLPVMDLAEQADLNVGSGIEVDQNCRTTDPVIYAVGDCASFPYRGGRIRLESVQNAIDMADVVARSILGKEVNYEPVPWFWSDQYSTKLQIAGLSAGYKKIATRKLTDSRQSFWYYDDQERFIAVDAINDPQAFMMAKRWLASGCTPSFEHIANTAVDLKSVSLTESADLTI